MQIGRVFTLVVGFLCLALGITGVIPAFVQATDFVPDAALAYGGADSYGDLFGVLPINTAEACFYLTVGALGLAAAAALDSARLYAGLLALVFGSFAILGAIPVASTLFGLFPIYGNDVWLHGAIAVLASYFGFLATPNLLQLWQGE